MDDGEQEGEWFLCITDVYIQTVLAKCGQLLMDVLSFFDTVCSILDLMDRS